MHLFLDYPCVSPYQQAIYVDRVCDYDFIAFLELNKYKVERHRLQLKNYSTKISKVMNTTLPPLKEKEEGLQYYAT